MQTVLVQNARLLLLANRREKWLFWGKAQRLEMAVKSKGGVQSQVQQYHALESLRKSLQSGNFPKPLSDVCKKTFSIQII